MFIRELLSLYRTYKKEHKDEVAKIKLEKRLLKHPLNYVLLEEFLKLFCDNSSKKDLVFEATTADGTKIKLFFDNRNELRRETTIESIMRSN